jgi:hypothetical protein
MLQQHLACFEWNSYGNIILLLSTDQLTTQLNQTSQTWSKKRLCRRTLNRLSARNLPRVGNWGRPRSFRYAASAISLRKNENKTLFIIMRQLTEPFTSAPNRCPQIQSLVNSWVGQRMRPNTQLTRRSLQISIKIRWNESNNWYTALWYTRSCVSLTGTF